MHDKKFFEFTSFTADPSSNKEQKQKDDSEFDAFHEDIQGKKLKELWRIIHRFQILIIFDTINEIVEIDFIHTFIAEKMEFWSIRSTFWNCYIQNTVLCPS